MNGATFMNGPAFINGPTFIDSGLMKLARKMEQRMERLVEGLSATVFRGRIHPIEVADRLIRHIDRTVDTGSSDPTAPNTYVIRVSPSELPDELDIAALQDELALVVTETASDRGWRLGGPVSVTVTADSTVGRGVIEIDHSSQPGQLAPWAQLIDTRQGRLFDVADNRALIGRAPDSDIVLSEAMVSRHHAVVFRARGGAWLTDLGSANGTQLNGVAIGEQPVPVTTGDAVTFGPATFTFKAR